MSACLPLDYDCYMGYSNDFSVWGLVLFSWELDEEMIDRIALHDACHVILIEPEMKDVLTIKNILLHANMRYINHGKIDERSIQEIFKLYPFPHYVCAKEYLPGIPELWADLEVEISFEIVLSEGACVYRGLFEELEVTSFDSVMRILYGPRFDGLLIHYHLQTVHEVPFLQWELDSPLARRGNETPKKRSLVEGMLPGQEEENCRLITIYQYLPGRGPYSSPAFFKKPIIRMRVGGRTEEETVSNWIQCACILRPMRQRIINKIKTHPNI